MNGVHGRWRFTYLAFTIDLARLWTISVHNSSQLHNLFYKVLMYNDRKKSTISVGKVSSNYFIH